jgi:uncharacterized delta-60 repeat protein
MLVVRLTTDGVLDSTFGSNGMVSTPIRTAAWTLGVVVQPDGKILVSGTSQLGNEDNDMAVVRYLPDGSLDASFGAGGVVMTDALLPGMSHGTDLELQPDGKIVVTGNSIPGGSLDTEHHVLVARLEPDGSPDPFFGTGGFVTTDRLPGLNEHGRNLVLQPDGEIVTLYQYTDFYDLALLRYLGDEDPSVGMVRVYRLTGTSEGIGWSMGLRAAGGGGFYAEALENGPLPAGASPADFAEAFVAALSEISTSIESGLLGGQGTFFLRLPGIEDFELGVGLFGVSPDCWMPPESSCEFNPLIEDITHMTTVESPSSGRKSDIANYPNPFNARTVIAFELARGARADLGIYDLSGQIVRKLLSGEFLTAGRHGVSWDGRDEDGRQLATGVYIYRLVAGEFQDTGRTVLVK